MANLKGWNENLTEMPADKRFEVIRVRKVFRSEPNKLLVVEPETGRMYKPTAWRPIKDKH